MQDFDTILLVYAALFPIVNPIGSTPIFLGLTRNLSPGERSRLAGRVALNSFLLLLGSLFVGSHVLAFFGITLPAVRVAGGLVVTAFGWSLLHADRPLADQREAAAAGHIDSAEAFYPLTMPLTVGPGSMSVAITLGSQRPMAADLQHLGSLVILASYAVAGLLAIALTIYVCFRYGERLVRALGPTGTGVVIRLSAFIMLCIGIEILWSGYSAFMGRGA